MKMEIESDYTGKVIFERLFHGCYYRGTQVCYYKPSDTKHGPLWLQDFRDPKTGKRRFHDIYGGKLAGILTQSLCREIFFQSLRDLSNVLAGYSNVKIIGQFHDEIVVDWTPPHPVHGYATLGLDTAKTLMNGAMSRIGPEFDGFPLGADIKSAYRYIK